MFIKDFMIKMQGKGLEELQRKRKGGRESQSWRERHEKDAEMHKDIAYGPINALQAD